MNDFVATSMYRDTVCPCLYALFVKWAKRNVGGTDTQCLTYRAPLRSLQQRHYLLYFSVRFYE